MNPAVGAIEAFAGGMGVVFTPGFALSLLAVLAAGLALGARLKPSRHLAVVGALVLIIAAATWRRGVGAEGLSSVAAGLASFAALALLLRTEDCPWWRAALGGLLIGVTTVLWRVEAFGPVLAELRGPWQSAPASGRLAVYHFGTAVAVAAFYTVAAGAGMASGRVVGDLVSWLPWAGLAAVAIVVVLTGQWPSIVQFLMLKWPHVSLG